MILSIALIERRAAGKGEAAVTSQRVELLPNAEPLSI